MREILRALPTLIGRPPPLDEQDLPALPGDLHRNWLLHAVEAGVPEPHACGLATADSQGRPSARVLILKDLGAEHWSFATSPRSRKGQELADNPHVAVTSYWPSLLRQVRIVGTAHQADASESGADFAARPAAAQAEALVGRQSQPLSSREAVAPAVEAALERLGHEQQHPPAWNVYRVTAREVEFWQGDPSRRHVRVQYRRNGTTWSRGLLWP